MQLFYYNLFIAYISTLVGLRRREVTPFQMFNEAISNYHSYWELQETGLFGNKFYH